MKLQWKIALIVTVSTAICILVTYLMLALFLRAKDLTEAKKDYYERALLIRQGLLNVMINTGDYDKIAGVLDQIRKEQKTEIRLVRSPHVIKQYGVKRNEYPADDLEREVLKSGKFISVQDTESSLKIIFPFITNEKCGLCHVGEDGKRLPADVVNGLAVIKFDLSNRRKESLAVANGIIGPLVGVMALSALVILILVNRTVTKPVTKIAETITGFREEKFETDFPIYTTTEIRIMAEEVRNTAEKLATRKKEMESEIEAERTRNAEINRIIRNRAAAMGIESGGEITSLLSRLSSAVDEAERAGLMTKALPYVKTNDCKLLLPSDPSVVPAVSVYLGNVVSGCAETIKRRSIELVMDEALTNAIVHGNLGVSSELKDIDFDEFNNVVAERMMQEPYCKRVVNVEYQFDGKQIRFHISDEGKGFNWSEIMAVEEGDLEGGHGRGLIIMRALATEIVFNEQGNHVSLMFDLSPTPPHNSSHNHQA